MDGGDGCMTMRTLNAADGTLKMVKMVHFMLCVS